MTFAIGIDPSLSATGICWGALAGKTIKLKADDPSRLVKLCDEVEDVVAGYLNRALARDPFRTAPLLAVIEDLPTHAMSAGLTGQAQGVIRMVLQDYAVPYLTVPPASLKKFATGSGTAGKDAMAAACPHALPAGWDDNTVDAYWLRQMGLHYLDTVGYDPLHFKARVAKWSTLPTVAA